MRYAVEADADPSIDNVRSLSVTGPWEIYTEASSLNILREAVKKVPFTLKVEPPNSQAVDLACNITFVQFANDDAGLRVQESAVSDGKIIYAKPARAEAAHIIISLDADQQTRYVRASHVRKSWQDAGFIVLPCSDEFAKVEGQVTSPPSRP